MMVDSVVIALGAGVGGCGEQAGFVCHGQAAGAWCVEAAPVDRRYAIRQSSTTST
jgi:hypothetical protein